MKLHFTNDWLKQAIEEEPYLIVCDAGFEVSDDTIEKIKLLERRQKDSAKSSFSVVIGSHPTHEVSQ